MCKLTVCALLLLIAAVPVSSEMIVDTTWVRIYRGLGNGNDYPRAIAVDDSGNVYVSGYAYGDGTKTDYTTIKYDALGNQIWVAVYDGPAHRWDEVYDMTIDDKANIYITGCSNQGDTILDNYDYVTVKYDSAGNELWVQRYDGSEGHNDEAYAIAVDATGNSYVTGFGGCESDQSSGYVTIKYSTDGTEDWVACYQGPENGSIAYAITVDEHKNIYVAGDSWGGGMTGVDYAVVKYDSLGNEVWARRYDGPAHSTEFCNDVQVDRYGNVYITGWSYGVGTDYDWATVKYDSAGNELWVRRYNGPANGEDVAGFLVVDDSGNVYVTGPSLGFETGYDCTTVKYDPNGNEVWIKRYNGDGNDLDSPWGLVLDDSCNIYVVGQSIGTFKDGDYVTIKYDSSGTQIWVKRYHRGEGDGEDRGRAIAIDSHGNILVTGSSQGNGTLNDYLTIKYKQINRPFGDVNIDGAIDLEDVVYLLNYLFKGGLVPEPIESGDVDCDNFVDISDVIYLLNYLFKGGDPPNC